MTLLDKLKADLELAEKAASGEWRCVFPMRADNSGELWGPKYVETTLQYKCLSWDDSKFIAASRIRWPATTVALIKAIDCLGRYACVCAEYRNEDCPGCKALAEIERIMEKK